MCIDTSKEIKEKRSYNLGGMFMPRLDSESKHASEPTPYSQVYADYPQEKKGSALDTKSAAVSFDSTDAKNGVGILTPPSSEPSPTTMYQTINLSSSDGSEDTVPANSQNDTDTLPNRHISSSYTNESYGLEPFGSDDVLALGIQPSPSPPLTSNLHQQSNPLGIRVCKCASRWVEIANIPSQNRTMLINIAENIGQLEYASMYEMKNMFQYFSSHDSMRLKQALARIPAFANVTFDFVQEPAKAYVVDLLCNSTTSCASVIQYFETFGDIEHYKVHKINSVFLRIVCVFIDSRINPGSYMVVDNQQIAVKMVNVDHSFVCKGSSISPKSPWTGSESDFSPQIPAMSPPGSLFATTGFYSNPNLPSSSMDRYQSPSFQQQPSRADTFHHQRIFTNNHELNNSHLYPKWNNYESNARYGSVNVQGNGSLSMNASHTATASRFIDDALNPSKFFNSNGLISSHGSFENAEPLYQSPSYNLPIDSRPSSDFPPYTSTIGASSVTSQPKKLKPLQAQKHRPHAPQTDATTEIDLSAIANNTEKRTTVMLRNIPNKLEFQDLKQFLDSTSAKNYDFLYLRFDFENKCNMGYAFISFTSPQDVAKFMKERAGLSWSLHGYNSEKIIDIRFARIQGRHKLIEKFRNSRVMHQEPKFRPRLYYSSGPLRGAEEPFPNPTR